MNEVPVKFAAAGVTIVGLAAGALLAPLRAQQTPPAVSAARSVWDGVYTIGIDIEPLKQIRIEADKR